MNIDYVYVYPKNWNGCKDNIICQKIVRGEKYNLNPIVSFENKNADIKKLENLDILIDDEEDEEQKAWLKRKKQIILLRNHQNTK